MSIIETVNANQIEAQLREFIVENFFVEDELDATESLTDAGVIDSTGVLEVVSWIEDTFAVTVPDADILPDNLDSIARIVRYVTGCVGA
ncbi:MAG: acyl carrier protein [Acidimicrobiales bacterium]|nr:acyl carrier protein [Acidimicrobiales bacterium]